MKQTLIVILATLAFHSSLFAENKVEEEKQKMLVEITGQKTKAGQAANFATKMGEKLYQALKGEGLRSLAAGEMAQQILPDLTMRQFTAFFMNDVDRIIVHRGKFFSYACESLVKLWDDKAENGTISVIFKDGTTLSILVPADKRLDGLRELSENKTVEANVPSLRLGVGVHQMTYEKYSCEVYQLKDVKELARMYPGAVFRSQGNAATDGQVQEASFGMK